MSDDDRGDLALQRFSVKPVNERADTGMDRYVLNFYH
jgi:hypothetical protein